jgi:two-component system phosphate regulon sensor histidine kinase PhoR
MTRETHSPPPPDPYRHPARSLTKRMHGKFFWKLFMGHALLLIAVAGACVWLMLGAFNDLYRRQLSADLRTKAEFLRDQVHDRFDDADQKPLNTFAKAMNRTDDGDLRVTFISGNGIVLGDSQAAPADMENHADRPEFRQALQSGTGESTRWSSTLSQRMKYVAVRVGSAEDPKGIIRVALPVRSILAQTESARSLFLRLAAIAALGAVLLALGLARFWSSRIARVTEAARSFSKGDLSARADVSGSDEVTLLALSLNRMRDHLVSQLGTIDRQRRTLERLLEQLHEGVIVADPDGRTVLVNPAAAELLNLRPAGQAGDQTLKDRALDVGALPPQLQVMLRSAKETAGDETTECRLTIERPGGEVVLLARAWDIALPEFSEGTAGGSESYSRLLVLTDITELGRMIQVKADFVANASHELRTPLSAIRTAVETLLSINMSEDTEAAIPLLGVIDRHSERLNELVADLLDLSRVESPAAQFEPVTVSFKKILTELHDRFAERIKAKNLNWEVALDPGTDTMHVNPQLLTLVLDNLVDNAIKYTEPGGRISIATGAVDRQVRITVQDDGCGIPPKDQDRVFERFYQVERARTGGKRGTGLGLAIVRHAISALNGHVTLHSQPGQGTRLDVYLPRPTT